MRDILMLALGAGLACAPPERNGQRADSPRDTSAVAGHTAASGAGAAPAQTAREIYIDSVRVANPLVVFGRARTFENVVQVRVRDARGALLSETHTMSAGDMGQHNPFSARLWLTRAPGPRVIVEAFEYSAKDGSVRSLVADTIGAALEARVFALHFPAGDCANTRIVRREMPRTLSVARLLVEALVAGPDSSERSAGASAVFPAGSAVRAVSLRDGELVVDFNERLRNVGGSCAAQAIRVSVTRTLSQLPGVRTVSITADGSAALALQP